MRCPETELNITLNVSVMVFWMKIAFELVDSVK